MVLREEKNCKSYIEQFASWLDSTKVFQNISDAKPLNDDGTLNISDKFEYEKVENIVTIINKMTGVKSTAFGHAQETAPQTAPAEEVAVTEDVVEEVVEGEEVKEVKKGRGRPVGSTKK